MDNVLILGAGASAGYDCSEVGKKSPVARNFLQTTIELIQEGHIPDEFGNLWAFLTKYYCVDKEQIKNDEIDIEEVFTFLDLDDNYKDARGELIKMIYLTLNSILFGIRCPYLNRLINKLDSKDSIITFNWDLLADNIISDERSINPNYGTRFSKSFTGVWDIIKADAHSPRLLKMHGSMNWMGCKSCDKAYNYIQRGKVIVDTILNPNASWLKCPDCNNPLEPTIIPPTINKNFDQWPLFKQVWLSAKEALSKAKEITIVGYSLPPTDFRAKWLFMESIALRTEPLDKLTVVDKYPNDLFDKYKKIFQVDDSKFEGITGEIKCLVEQNTPND